MDFEVVKCDKQVFVQGESSARHNGLPFSLQYRTTRVALVKVTKNKVNPAIVCYTAVFSVVTQRSSLTQTNTATDKVRVESALE